ncbi:MAG: hypothetical protein WD530_02360 [Vicingaceae bacterium]
MKSIFLLSLITIFSYQLSAQCKGFTKRSCLPELSPYLSNGQFNAAYMIPGESADVEINFNQGLSYRLVICADPFLEGVNYQISDEDGFVYTTDTIKGKTAYTDLEVTQSKALTLSITIPDKENTTGIVRNGCVSILVGFKEQE